MSKQMILVVEDNPKNLKLTRTLLEIGGYRVIEAESAESGIHMAQEYRPDLILMDIQLPGMDGLEATRILKEDPELQATPVVALTSYAMQGDDDKAKAAGCDGYITKPIDTKSFLEQVPNYFRIPEPDVNHKGNTPTAFLGIKPRILIVDDEPKNVKLISAKLARQGYTLETAHDGVDALAKVAQNAPDLILLDIMMPGIDGYEVTRRLKGDVRTKNIPIILLTALDGLDDKARGMDVGADEYLVKPVKTVELQARVLTQLRMRNYQNQLNIRVESERQIYDRNRARADNWRGGDNQQVLIIDDDPKDTKLLQEYLKAEPYAIRTAHNATDALQILFDEPVDLVLLDVMLPDIDGFKLCRKIKNDEATRDIQVIFTTSLDDLDNKIKGVEQGADDYLAKPINRRELTARIQVLLQKKAYLDRLHNHCRLAMETGITDGLTGLYSPSYLRLNLELELKRAQRQGHMTALILVDIDGIKLARANCEYPIEDYLLREFAREVRKEIREIDVAARWRQRQFAIILPFRDPHSAKSVAENIYHRIAEYSLPQQTLVAANGVNPTVALAVAPIDATTADELLESATDLLGASTNGPQSPIVKTNEK